MTNIVTCSSQLDFASKAVCGHDAQWYRRHEFKLHPSCHFHARFYLPPYPVQVEGRTNELDELHMAQEVLDD